MNNFPAMTEEQRQELIEVARKEIKVWDDGGHYKELLQIALAALTADTSKLAELAAKVRKVREDAADFDGDRRGMWEYQEEQEQLLLEEAVKYTAPPVPVLQVPDGWKLVPKELTQEMATSAAQYRDVKEYYRALLSAAPLPPPPEASNEQ